MPISSPSMPSVPDGLHVNELKLDAAGLLITAHTTAVETTCPVCGRASGRVHGSYWRTFKDLPWQDRAVTWRVRVRRFRCPHCPGCTFAERVPGFAGTKARRSDRLAAAQADIGLVLGGEAGARLSRRLAMPVSGDTVLRLVRRRGIAPGPPPRVIGVDDWAWRRGRCYGTIVCDLERRRVIDLLPGRSAEPLRDWLAAHPSVRVVSRDRSGPCAEAARMGAPTAIQVADRWHLLINASDALRGIVEHHQPAIRRAAQQVVPAPPAPVSTVARATTPERDGRRRARCQAALRLHGEGVPIRVITSRIGASRNAVRRWVRAGRFVPYRRAPGPSRLDRHLRFIEARWREGERNAAALHRELRALGFNGGYDMVRHWAARQRRGEPARPPSARIPSTRRITRWLTSDPAALSPGDRRFTEALCAAAPGLKTAAEHVRTFAEPLRQRHPGGLHRWLDAVATTELRSFAAGLRQDESAVRAAMGEPWSNGPVEGQVNRLKLIKRSMYGRASFDLLRQRVLLAA